LISVTTNKWRSNNDVANNKNSHTCIHGKCLRVMEQFCSIGLKSNRRWNFNIANFCIFDAIIFMFNIRFTKIFFV